MSQTTRSVIQRDGIEWTNLLFLGGYHLALIVLLPIYLLGGFPSGTLIAGTAVLWAASLLAITMGYHRLYAHKTYKTHPVIEAILLFFGTLATQGSALTWSHDHRIHHSHVDTDKDPYGTEIGFWHSHVLWMFRKREQPDPKFVKDLSDNRLLHFQHRHYAILMVLANAVAIAGLWLLTGDLLGAFVIGFLLRLFFVHHCTWFINSLAHMWGSKPYSSEHSAVNNFILAFLTFGEGYHNYHHTFASDYRNGVRWYQFDPPKYVIWLMSKVGLAKDLRQVNRLTIDRKLVHADKNLLMDHIKSFSAEHRETFERRIEEAYENVSEKLMGLKTASERYQRLKERGDEEMEAMRVKMNHLRESVHQEMELWQKFVDEMLELTPQMAPQYVRA